MPEHKRSQIRAQPGVIQLFYHATRTLLPNHHKYYWRIPALIITFLAESHHHTVLHVAQYESISISTEHWDIGIAITDYTHSQVRITLAKGRWILGEELEHTTRVVEWDNSSYAEGWMLLLLLTRRRGRVRASEWKSERKRGRKYKGTAMAG